MQTLLPPVGIAAGVGAALYLREWTMEKPAGMKWTMVRRPRRLLCLDLDGTTYNAEHAVSRANADAIAAAARAGWAVALCTGRSPACQLPTAASLGVDAAHHQTLGLYLVACNGALVARTDPHGALLDTLFEATLSAATVARVRALAPAGAALKADAGARQFVECAGGDARARRLVDAHTAIEGSRPVDVCDVAAPPRDFWGRAAGPLHKLTVFTDDPAGLAAAAAAADERRSDGDGVALLRGGDWWCETSALAHDKAAGARRLCARLGLDIADVVALGDGANDATILAAVGVGIAMANARPEAKAAASRVSRWTNDEDAVAKEIWSLLEEERARRPWWRVW